MTTIAVRNGIMVSDGQSSFGDRIDQYNVKKIRKVNGCLVGGAGRFASILCFFDWFQEWSDAQLVQGEAPHVGVFVPEGIDDEDFMGLVLFADGTLFMYEGGKKSYELEDLEYYSIGSGSDYALAAMDAGATAEEAVLIAIKRDNSSGGTLTIEQLDEEPEELTIDKAKGMSKEELIKLIFGEEEKPEPEFEGPVESLESSEETAKLVINTPRVAAFDDFKILFKNPENGDILEELDLKSDESVRYGKTFKRVNKTLNRNYFDTVVKELGASFMDEPSNKTELLDALLYWLVDEIQNQVLTEEVK